MVTWQYPLPSIDAQLQRPTKRAKLTEAIELSAANTVETSSLLMQSIMLQSHYAAIAALPTAEEAQIIDDKCEKVDVMLQAERGSDLQKLFRGFIETVEFMGSKEEGYPLSQFANLWSSVSHFSPKAALKILALDCEMCDTGVR